jgi:hypothetical protein
LGDYQPEIRTCRLDKRFVLHDVVDPELIAAVIVHEATHARLHRLGVAYAEQQRPRIDAICVRRENAPSCPVTHRRPPRVPRILRFHFSSCQTDPRRSA